MRRSVVAAALAGLAMGSFVGWVANPAVPTTVPVAQCSADFDDGGVYVIAPGADIVAADPEAEIASATFGAKRVTCGQP
jgi:hypothetical protein